MSWKSTNTPYTHQTCLIANNQACLLWALPISVCQWHKQQELTRSPHKSCGEAQGPLKQTRKPLILFPARALAITMTLYIIIMSIFNRCKSQWKEEYLCFRAYTDSIFINLQSRVMLVAIPMLVAPLCFYGNTEWSKQTKFLNLAGDRMHQVEASWLDSHHNVSIFYTLYL